MPPHHLPLRIESQRRKLPEGPTYAGQSEFCWDSYAVFIFLSFLDRLFSLVVYHCMLSYTPPRYVSQFSCCDQSPDEASEALKRTLQLSLRSHKTRLNDAVHMFVHL